MREHQLPPAAVPGPAAPPDDEPIWLTTEEIPRDSWPAPRDAGRPRRAGPQQPTRTTVRKAPLAAAAGPPRPRRAGRARAGRQLLRLGHRRTAVALRRARRERHGDRDRLFRRRRRAALPRQLRRRRRPGSPRRGYGCSASPVSSARPAPRSPARMVGADSGTAYVADGVLMTLRWVLGLLLRARLRVGIVWADRRPAAGGPPVPAPGRADRVLRARSSSRSASWRPPSERVHQRRTPRACAGRTPPRHRGDRRRAGESPGGLPLGDRRAQFLVGRALGRRRRRAADDQRDLAARLAAARPSRPARPAAAGRTSSYVLVSSRQTAAGRSAPNAAARSVSVAAIRCGASKKTSVRSSAASARSRDRRPLARRGAGSPRSRTGRWAARTAPARWSPRSGRARR